NTPRRTGINLVTERLERGDHQWGPLAKGVESSRVAHPKPDHSSPTSTLHESPNLWRRLSASHDLAFARGPREDILRKGSDHDLGSDRVHTGFREGPGPPE
ncbi:MAG: hypothetical protein WKF75_03120, partial [Singulisphaera sp.]